MAAFIAAVVDVFDEGFLHAVDGLELAHQMTRQIHDVGIHVAVRAGAGGIGLVPPHDRKGWVDQPVLIIHGVEMEDPPDFAGLNHPTGER